MLMISLLKPVDSHLKVFDLSHPHICALFFFFVNQLNAKNFNLLNLGFFLRMKLCKKNSKIINQ